MGHRHYGVVFFLLFFRGTLKTSRQQITVKTVWCSICCRNDIGPQSRTKHTNYRHSKLLMREIFLCSQFLLSTFPPFCEMVSRFGWLSWIRHCVMHNPSVLYSQYCDFVGSYPSWWTLLILVVSRVTVCLSWNSVPHLRWLEKSGIWH